MASYLFRPRHVGPGWRRGHDARPYLPATDESSQRLTGHTAAKCSAHHSTNPGVRAIFLSLALGLLLSLGGAPRRAADAVAPPPARPDVSRPEEV